MSLTSLFRWFSSLSIRWKLQIGFFTVTMVTTIFNRWLASAELSDMIQIVKNSASSDDALIAELQNNYDAFIFNSFWESGIEFAIQFIIIGVVATLFVKPIKVLCTAVKKVENGDLTKGVVNNSRDEIGLLEHSFNEMVAKFNTIMHQIDESGKQMGQSAYQIVMISNEIASVGKQESVRSNNVTIAMEKLSETSNAVLSLTEEAMHNAKLTESQANEGIHTVQSNIQNMQATADEVVRASAEINELQEAAGKICHIVETINAVAEQTNLLSLNAAIEAARAGEQGRGFAVVADEVRSLAKGTTDSVGEISLIIEELTSRVQKVSTTMVSVEQNVQGLQGQAVNLLDVFETMQGEASETTKANENISLAATDQISQFTLLTKNLDNLFATFKDSSSKVESTATIGSDLYKITEKLIGLMNDFTIASTVYVEPARNEQRNYPRAENSLLTKIHYKGNIYDGISRDFSLSGMKIKLAEVIDKNEVVHLEVYLPNEDLNNFATQVPLKIEARVAWSKYEVNPSGHAKGYRMIGVHFLAQNDSTRQKLQSCFDYFSKQAEYSKAS